MLVHLLCQIQFAINQTASSNKNAGKNIIYQTERRESAKLGEGQGGLPLIAVQLIWLCKTRAIFLASHAVVYVMYQ